MVRDERGKWGGIDTNGNTIIPFEYDVVNDVFVDGKNIVIKGNQLIIIDICGNELKKLNGYNYLIPKLAEDEIIAFNAFEGQYDVIDFNGSIICRDCFPEGFKDNFSEWPKNKYKYLWYQYFRFNDIPYHIYDDVNSDRANTVHGIQSLRRTN